MNLGKRIQDLRRRRGLTTGELAARVQVTSGFISQLEHGKTDPSLQTLQRVAAALQVPLSYLMLEDETKPQVVRRGERNVIHVDQGGLRASMLSPLRADRDTYCSSLRAGEDSSHPHLPLPEGEGRHILSKPIPSSRRGICSALR